MLAFLWNLGAFIVALGILITAHEFGHFYVARRCGVRVQRFFYRFGKAIWHRIGKDGTEYVVAMIPLGGYVKMLDERVEEVPPELQHESFNR
ncbi:MAG: site-2 protease family protein, partial [Shewanella fodinae]|nr:site-2 protease family protein [Shewanella fodinae]